jgi:hypothetical protein
MIRRPATDEAEVVADGGSAANGLGGGGDDGEPISGGGEAREGQS